MPPARPSWGARVAASTTTRTQAVYADGVPDARVMVVGEAPGANEDRTGTALRGRRRQAPGPHAGVGGPVSRKRIRSTSATSSSVARPGNRNPQSGRDRHLFAVSPRARSNWSGPRRSWPSGTFAARAPHGCGATRPWAKLRGQVHRLSRDVPAGGDLPSGGPSPESAVGPAPPGTTSSCSDGVVEQSMNFGPRRSRSRPSPPRWTGARRGRGRPRSAVLGRHAYQDRDAVARAVEILELVACSTRSPTGVLFRDHVPPLRAGRGHRSHPHARRGAQEDRRARSAWGAWTTWPCCSWTSVPDGGEHRVPRSSWCGRRRCLRRLIEASQETIRNAFEQGERDVDEILDRGRGPGLPGGPEPGAGGLRPDQGPALARLRGDRTAPDLGVAHHRHPHGIPRSWTT